MEYGESGRLPLSHARKEVSIAAVKEVVQDWVVGRTVLGPRGLWVHGDSLYSYDVLIALRTRGGGTILVRMVPGPWYSQTTTRHRNLVRGVCRANGVRFEEN